MSHSWCAVSVGEAILPASSSVTSYSTQRVGGDSWTLLAQFTLHAILRCLEHGTVSSLATPCPRQTKTNNYMHAHTHTQIYIISPCIGDIEKHCFLGHNILWASRNSEPFWGKCTSSISSGSKRNKKQPKSSSACRSLQPVLPLYPKGRHTADSTPDSTCHCSCNTVSDHTSSKSSRNWFVAQNK
jgi:hypothetical protein